MILQPGERSAASDLNRSISGARKEASKLQDIFGATGPLTRDMSMRMGETAQSVFRLREGLLESTNLTERIQSIGSTIFESMQNNAFETNTALTDAVSKLIQKVKLSNDSDDVERQVLQNIRESNVVQREITKEAVKVFNTRQEEKETLEKLFKDQKEQFKLIKEDRDSKLKEVERTKEELKNEKDSLRREQISRDLQKQISDLQLVEYNLSLKGSETGQTRVQLAQATEAASLSIQDIQKVITSDLEKQVIDSVKLATNYADLQDLTQNIQDSQVANATIVSKLAALESNRAIEAFKEKNNLQEASEAEILNRFQLNQLNQGLTLAEQKRKKLLEESGGVVTDEVDLIDDIIRSTRKEINLNIENIDKLSLIRELEEEIKEEKEKQSIIDKVKLDLGNKFTSILGDQGDELLEIGKAFKESMVSPLALVGALLGSALEEFSKIGVESRKFLDTTNLTVKQTEHVRHLAHDISLEYRAQGVEMENVLNATGALVNKYGSLNRVSDEAIEKVTLLGKAFGISEDNAAGVMYQIQASTGASAETAGNIAALGAQFAEAAGVAPDAVMADIAKSSEQIATYFKGTPQDLLRTAVEARRLGLDIGKVADISKNLLNFESSIEDQMTASVLLGREINLDKARQLAMEGKIEEAAKETLSQVGDLASFNKMNAVQKEAIAKAAGLTVAELQQSLEKQDAINNMTAAQRAEYEKNLGLLNEGNESAADRLLKEQRNQLTQEKIADAVAKIADIFANVLLPVLEPIFDLISGIFSFIEPALPFLKTGLQLFLGYKLAAFLLNTEFFKTRGLLGTLAAPFQMIGKGLTSAREGVVNLYKSTKDWLTKAKEGDGIWKSLKDKLSGLGPTLKSFFLGKGPKEWGKEATESFDKASKAGGSFFDKMKGWMEKFSFGPIDEEADDLESTLQDIAKSDLEKMGAEPIENAASTLQEKAQEKISEVVSPESAVESASTTLQDKAQEKGEELVGSVKESFMPDKVAESAEQAQEVEGKMATSSGEGTKTFLTNLAEGLKKMGEPGVFKGALNLIPAGIGLIAMIPGYFGAKLLEKVDGEKLKTTLTGLGDGLEKLGSGKALFGSVVLAAAGVALTAGVIGFALIAGLGVAIGAGLQAMASGLAALGNPAALEGGLILSGVALSLGASLLMMGAGLYLAATGMAALVQAFAGLNSDQILGAVGAITAMGVGIYFLIPALIGLATTAGATSGPLLALGAALLMIGGGVFLMSQGMAAVVESFKGLAGEDVSAGIDALFKFAPVLPKLAIGLFALGAAAAIAGGPMLIVGEAIMMMGIGIGAAAAGFSLLVTAIGSASDELIKLINNVEIDQLLAIAGGLTAIGLALSSISMFGMLALPALGAIAAISLGAGALFGGGEETTTAPAAAEEETGGTDNSALIAKMDELIAVITNSTTPIQLVVDGKVMAEAVGRKTERNYQANPRK